MFPLEIKGICSCNFPWALSFHYPTYFDHNKAHYIHHQITVLLLLQFGELLQRESSEYEHHKCNNQQLYSCFRKWQTVQKLFYVTAINQQ